MSIPDWLSWNQNSVFESQSEIDTWQGGICKSCRLVWGAEERVLLAASCMVVGTVPGAAGGELAVEGDFWKLCKGELEKKRKESMFREGRRSIFFRVKLGENRGEGEVENYGELSFKITGKQLEENQREEIGLA